MYKVTDRRIICQSCGTDVTHFCKIDHPYEDRILILQNCPYCMQDFCDTCSTVSEMEFTIDQLQWELEEAEEEYDKLKDKYDLLKDKVSCQDAKNLKKSSIKN